MRDPNYKPSKMMMGIMAIEAMKIKEDDGDAK